MHWKQTLQHLRLPFSFFLMPVFLFAVSQTAPPLNYTTTIILFIILHVLVYPSSNAYNSYMDQDTASIGGLKHPPLAGKQLFPVTLVLDVLALLLSVLVSVHLLICILAYILASRAYSYRGIRLKKYPIVGYLTVFFFQGGFTYYLCASNLGDGTVSIYAALASSFLTGGVYPLTQIYQHKQDEEDGVKTISMLVGYMGTFMLTAFMFTIATVLLWFHFNSTNHLHHFWLMQASLLPVVVYFGYWFIQVKKSTSAASYEHTMRMNVIASICMNTCFALLCFTNLTS
jgi:1,4-dihydroxy-2-naphthoate octaprenyltransferase